MAYVRSRGFAGTSDCYPVGFVGPIPDGSSYCDPLAGLSVSGAGNPLASTIGPIPDSGTASAATASGPCIGTTAPYLGVRDSMGLCQPSWMFAVGLAVASFLLMGMLKHR